MIHFQKMRSRRLSFLKNFLKLTVSYGINLQSLNMKFQEKIFTTIKVIQLWNFGNFGIPEIIPKNPGSFIFFSKSSFFSNSSFFEKNLYFLLKSFFKFEKLNSSLKNLIFFFQNLYFLLSFFLQASFQNH